MVWEKAKRVKTQARGGSGRKKDQELRGVKVRQGVEEKQTHLNSNPFIGKDICHLFNKLI